MKKPYGYYANIAREVNKKRIENNINEICSLTVINYLDKGYKKESLYTLKIKAGGARKKDENARLLTDLEFTQALEMYNSGYYLKEITERFGVSRSYFYHYPKRFYKY